MTAELVETQALTATEARALTDQIRQTLRIGHDLIIKAFAGRAWSALGYQSWDAYCAGEFAEARMVRLDREQRREIVAEMRQAGMSTRAISSGIGVPQGTVKDDVKELSETTQSPAKVTSLDGRQRPATKPFVAKSDESASVVNTITGEVLDDDPQSTDDQDDAQPTPDRKPRRRPLPDQARDAGWELRKSVERLERIAADDRFSSHTELMAAQLRGHLTHAVEVCQDLLDRIDNNKESTP